MESYLLPSLKRSGEEGLLKSDGIKEMPQEEITGLLMKAHGGALWSRHIAEGFGTAMRIRGSRAQNISWRRHGEKVYRG